jgi:hypothetical protein
LPDGQETELALLNEEMHLEAPSRVLISVGVDRSGAEGDYLFDALRLEDLFPGPPEIQDFDDGFTVRTYSWIIPTDGLQCRVNVNVTRSTSTDIYLHLLTAAEREALADGSVVVGDATARCDNA